MSVNLKSKLCRPGFFQKTNAGAIFNFKIAAAFVFWKNRGHHILFRDLLTFSSRVSIGW